MKLTVCVDFDGVLNTYTGWQGDYQLFEPREGVKAFLAALAVEYRVVIHTTREPRLVWAWLDEYDLGEYIFRVTPVKPPAVAYIDDRAILFSGDYAQTLGALSTFKAHWEQ